jgi:hypothetical protein
MKKVLVLICGLFLISFVALPQPEKDLKSTNSSLTITVAPTFFATLDAELNPETFWPTSLYVTKNFILRKRLSFSTGVHLLYKRTIGEGDKISEFGGYSGPIKITRKFGVFDIPLRLSFHIVKPNDKFNIYVKTECKNSLFASHLKGEPDFNGEYSSKLIFGYNMFLGIGFGFDFKVMNRLSLVFEPGLNYSVLGRLPDVVLIDCQVGVKYKLNK